MPKEKLTTLEDFEDFQELLLSKLKIAKMKLGGCMTTEKDEIKNEWDEKVDKIDIMKLHLWVFETSEFPLHLRHLLENNNIKTIGDLVQKSEQDLLKIPQFGLVRLRYVNLTLGGIGLSLRIEETDEERDYHIYKEAWEKRNK